MNSFQGGIFFESMRFENLKLKPVAIGSLPHTNIQSAIEIVENYFGEIPFPPQLANLNKNEDMIVQLLEGMPSFCAQNPQDFLLDVEDEKFLSDLEEFFTDYEDIMADINSVSIEKYAISNNFFRSFKYFEEIIRNKKPQYAKSQITGAFTFTTSINDINGKSIIYDDTLRDLSVKFLTLKALWMIKHIKSANSDTVPIIFTDEPSMSQLGTSAYLTVDEDEAVKMIKEIFTAIKSAGALSAIHCCGKCDWRIPIKAGVDIINFDAYSYFENFSIYHKEIHRFLQQGGKVAWGIVPTSDEKILDKLTVSELKTKFEKSVKYLTEKGINEKLILDNSIITSSCGAGSLTEQQAEKAMKLVCELSKDLRERF